MPKVSVIVPCYNAKDTIDRTMEYIIKQSIGIENIEIILIDDASTDNGATLDKLMGYERKFPNSIIFIPLSENVRQGGARNVGIEYATGEYILFCDADDWITFNALEILYNIAEKTSCDVIEFDSIDTYNYDTDDNAIDKGEDEFWEIETIEQRKANVVNRKSTLGCWNKMYKSQIIKDYDIRFPQQVFFEEPMFTYMVRFFEKKHYYVHKVLHYCYQHAGSATRGLYEEHKFDNLVTIGNLYTQLVKNGFDGVYREEIEYIFWHWYFLSTLIFAVNNGSWFTCEELVEIQETTRDVVSNIRTNKYFLQRFGDIPELAELTYCKINNDNYLQIRDLLLKIKKLYRF